MQQNRPVIEKLSIRAQTSVMRYVILMITVLVCSSCVAQDPYVRLKGQKFTVELADTQEKQALGLMFRDSMPNDHGMVFLFPGEAMRSFWMKNTRIPLDIFYFDQDLKTDDLKKLEFETQDKIVFFLNLLFD